jgi:hypothetical protein
MNKNNKTEAKNVIPFSRCFYEISPYDLELILEWLEDNKYLSEKGKGFRGAFWNLFIKGAELKKHLQKK